MTPEEFRALVGSMDLTNPKQNELCRILLQRLDVFQPAKRERGDIEKAFTISFEGHQNAPSRKSGEAYIFHPFRAAVSMFTKMELLGIFDARLIIAILLHDCVEDAKKAGISPLLMRGRVFIHMGGKVTADVYTLTKHSERGETRLEYNKRLLATDRWRPLAAKFEDRKDNLDTIESLPREKQMSKVYDAEQWFPHFAHRLQILIDKAVDHGRLDKQFLHLPALLHWDLKGSVSREKARLGMP